MPGPILKDKDKIIWNFQGVIKVSGVPLQISGSGKPTINAGGKKNICVESDLKKLEGMYSYTSITPLLTTPGQGQLRILPDNGYKSQIGQIKEEKVLLNGNGRQFSITFTVKAPASEPDEATGTTLFDTPERIYPGSVQFPVDPASQHIKSS